MKTLVILTHPNIEEKSYANKMLKSYVETIDNVDILDLYKEYGNGTFSKSIIDVKKEQERLTKYDLIVFQHPFYWYTFPALLKQYLDDVLLYGFAYGSGGDKLKGKKVVAAVTTGGAKEAYARDGYNYREYKEFLYPLERTVVLCGMDWQEPFVTHGAKKDTLNEESLKKQAENYKDYILKLMK